MKSRNWVWLLLAVVFGANALLQCYNMGYRKAEWYYAAPVVALRGFGGFSAGVGILYRVGNWGLGLLFYSVPSSLHTTPSPSHGVLDEVPDSQATPPLSACR